MTRVTEVSQKEMRRRTGLPNALGYAFPAKDEVLVRKELKGKARKEVLRHEMEHMRKGEEGPFDITGGLIAAGASVLGGMIQGGATKDAAKQARQAELANIELQREMFEQQRQDYGPYRQAGYTALDALMSMTGLPRSAGYQEAVGLTQPGEKTDGTEDAGEWPRYVRTFNSGYQMQPGPEYEWMDIGDGVYGWGPRQSGYVQPKSAQHGGVIQPYNVAEIAPEDVYSAGKVMRYAMPRTISRQQGGYVAPTNTDTSGYPPGVIIGPGEIPPPTSIPVNQPVTAAPQPQAPAQSFGVMDYPENPGGDESYSFMTDPGYNFRFNEGMRALERSAAARGGLLSGGFGRKAVRYGQDYAANEYTNVYNRIANIAGLASIPTQGSAQAAANYGVLAGNAQSNIGAYGAMSNVARGNVWGQVANDIGQIGQQLFNSGVFGGSQQTPSNQAFANNAMWNNSIWGSDSLSNWGPQPYQLPGG